MFADIKKQLEQIKLEIEDIANSEDVAKALVEFYPDQGTYLNPATHVDEWNAWLDVEVLQSFGEIEYGLQKLQRIFDKAQTPPPAEEEYAEEESIFES